MGLIWAGILLGIGLMLAPLVFRAAVMVALMLLYLVVGGLLLMGIFYYPLAAGISAIVIGVVIWATVTFCQWADRVQERQARRHEL